mmetsp:Transcript_41471/g.81314  ORF Transcript_41471/g.81314 Transcript_41471/m.81314 type:complete len:276 (-) Transcript_41471:992-1819(-)
MCVQTRSRNHLSWLTTIPHPMSRKSFNPSSNFRSVSTSRSLVGSSRISTLQPRFSDLARWTRFRSPPDSWWIFFSWAWPPKLNWATYCRGRIVIELLITISSSFPAISCHTLLSSSNSSLICSLYANVTVFPRVTSPLSGFTLAVISLRRVVLPQPLGPTIPTTCPLNSRNVKSLNRGLRSTEWLTWSHRITTPSPRRGPSGMIMDPPSFLRASSFSSLSAAISDICFTRDLPVALPPFCPLRSHLSSDSYFLSSTFAARCCRASRWALCSSQAV